MEKYPEKIEKMMNPIPKKDYNPETFDYMENTAGKEWKRKRILPPKELPTCGLKPKEIREGQMIGVYEGNQNIYLIFAHRCNELQKIVEDLEIRIKELEL